MVYSFDPRSNRENITSKSSPRRLLEDILTSKIVQSMSFGTASNYLTQAYGSSHRILYEGVARLLADQIVSATDNLDDIEFTQLRAEFIATRLMYQVFPNEESLPVGDNHEETIQFLLQTYESLLQGATEKSVNEVLNDIAEGNGVVVSDVEGYLASIKTSILATSEYNTDGVFTKHRHFTFTDEKGLGSTNKPIEFKWGEDLHVHDIIDGVIQPYVDSDGKSHSHEVYLGIPENIIRLQSNLRKVLGVTKPAHIKVGEVSSIIDEDIPILTKGKQDVFSPILGLGSQTDEQIIIENTIDDTLPYYNQNALYGLVGLSLGAFHQEEMRRAREGVYESEFYGYASGNTIRVWRTNVQVADNLVLSDDNPNTQDQKFRVISVESGIKPVDDIYQKITDSDGMVYTIKTVRDLNRGASSSLKKITLEDVEIINGSIYPIEEGGIREGQVGNTQSLNDGEPISLRDKVYFCELKADLGQYLLDLGLVREPNMSGHRVGLVATVITVDSRVQQEGLIKFKNNSSPWNVRDELKYETVTFTNIFDEARWGANYNYAINLPNFIVKDMLKSIGSLPVSMNDITIKIDKGAGFVDPDYSYSNLFLDSINWYTFSDKDGIMRISDRTYTTVGANNYATPLISQGDKVQITYPKAKSEIRRFRELNSLEMTLNATRPTRKVSESGRGIGQNRVIETTSPISYVLNDPQPVTPFTQEQKIATYSVGSSDLLNTKNQNLYTSVVSDPLVFNSTYTLNNFSLNQTATQDQVFKPATKTITTSTPKIYFYNLGFKPSYITSVVDSSAVSYSYTLNQDHVLVSGLTSEKTLTITGISSNPFSSDLDWYKGEKLAEGQAFFKHTKTSDLHSLTESTPEEYMQNPLGVPSDLTIRSVYSMNETTNVGVEGELDFYEDKVTKYEFKQDEDGRDGFASEYNTQGTQDEVLYPDPTLYVLGPISGSSSGGSVNTIPTYLFFGYFMLNDGDSNLDLVYHLSIYRIDGNGDKQYQTLTPIQDPNGDTALQLSGTLPESNGSPLAYRFLGDNGFGSLEYNPFSSTAYANISFNHIPSETYYMEVFFEESPAGGASFLGFIARGSNSNVALSDSWSMISQDFGQNEVDFLGQGGSDTSETYQITFTNNPGGGEVDTISFVADPDATATKSTENVGLTHSTTVTTYSATDYYPIRTLEYDYGYKRLFTES